MQRSVLRLNNVEPVQAYVVASDRRYFISAPSVALPNGALPFVGLCTFDYGEERLTCLVDQITAKRSNRIDALHEFDIMIEAVRLANT